MDFVRLSSNDPDTFGGNPDIKMWSIDAMIQNWSSLIWTERYTEAGDFTLVTPEIDSTLKALPLDSFVSILDSQETMMVEKREVTYDSFGTPELTITGRSVEAFLGNRHLHGDFNSWDSTAGPPDIAANAKNGRVTEEGVSEEPQENWETWNSYRLEQVAALIIWNTVVDPTYIVTGVGGLNWNDTKKRFFGESKDILPHIITSTTGAFTDTPEVQSLKLGELYTQVLEFLNRGKLGIRSLRPINNVGSVRVVSFNNDGFEVRTNVSNPQKLRFDIYKGIDRRSTVVLSHEGGDLLNPRYVFTSEGVKNVASVDSDAWGKVEVARDGDGASLSKTGFDRRVIYEKFDTPKNARKAADYRRMINRRGRAILAQNKAPAVFDGEIDVDSGVGYTFGRNKDYYLGDIVQVKGRYGVNQAMRVMEYVRTQDENGENAYPTLALP